MKTANLKAKIGGELMKFSLLTSEQFWRHEKGQPTLDKGLYQIVGLCEGKKPCLLMWNTSDCHFKPIQKCKIGLGHPVHGLMVRFVEPKCNKLTILPIEIANRKGT